MPNTEPVRLLLVHDEQQTTTSRATKAGWSTGGLALALSMLALLISLVALSRAWTPPNSRANPLLEEVIRTNCKTGSYLAGWDAFGEPLCRTPPVRQPMSPGADATIMKAQEDTMIPTAAIPHLPDKGTK